MAGGVFRPILKCTYRRALIYLWVKFTIVYDDFGRSKRKITVEPTEYFIVVRHRMNASVYLLHSYTPLLVYGIVRRILYSSARVRKV